MGGVGDTFFANGMLPATASPALTTPVRALGHPGATRPNIPNAARRLT